MKKFDSSLQVIVAILIVLILVQLALHTYTEYSLLDAMVQSVEYAHNADISFRAALLGQ